MEFHQLPFDNMNESEVRTAVIDPLLNHLGYRIGGEHAILQERDLGLRYSFISLGRKKRGKDPAVRGKPDYICEVRGYSRWIVEAKPPNAPISTHDIEQAHSYANHGEVQAPFYVICNGRRFMLFQTNKMPAGKPLLDISYEEISFHLHAIENLLSPVSLQRRYQTIELDLGRSLAPGFGSTVRIIGGTSRVQSVDYFTENMPPDVPDTGLKKFKELVGMNFATTGDRCYRAEGNAICAEVRSMMPTALMGEFSAILGLEVLTYVCHDEEVSTSAAVPSIFQARFEKYLPAGTLVPEELYSRTTVPLVAGMNVAILAEANCYIDDQKIVGQFMSLTKNIFELPQNLSITSFVSGDLTIEIAG